MTKAICLKCGTEKAGAWIACNSCGVCPKTSSELAVSLALSDQLSSNAQLIHYTHEILNHLKLSIPRETLAQALELLKNPALRTTIAQVQATSATATPPSSPPKATTSAPPPPPEAVNTTDSVRIVKGTTALHQVAFAVLGATTRDDRKRIVELAEERSLDLDHEVCQKARSDLTNPRNRLSAEISWLPGISPRKAIHLLETLHREPMAVRGESGLPTLAHLNLLSAAFESVGGDHAGIGFVNFIQEIASLVELLDAEAVMRDINEDRAVSGFPEVRGVDQVEEELTERRRVYRNVIKEALDKLAPTTLIEVMTQTVDTATAGGIVNALSLVDDLVDSYEVETQGILQTEAQTIQKLIQAARDSAPSGENAVKPYIDKIVLVTRNWDKIAQPIQLSAKARGITHDASHAVAFAIRKLGVDLFNEHDMMAHAQRLTQLIKELFSEVTAVSERVEEDAQTLDSIAQTRNDASTIAPIRKLCENARESCDRDRKSAIYEGQRVLEEGLKLLRATCIRRDSPTYAEASNLIAATVLQCAIAYGNETSKWGPCVNLVEGALSLAVDPELRKKASENLTIVKNNQASLGDLEPIKSAPSLSTVNGFGTLLYGNTDPNPSNGSHMATYYFVFFFIPIFALSRYRVIPTGGGYRFLGKGSLRGFDIWHNIISIGLIAFMIFKK